MKVKIHGANKTELELNNGSSVFFSYETPVAAFVPGKGYLRTKTHYSRTTSKHITQWLAGSPAKEVPQEEINSIAS